MREGDLKIFWFLLLPYSMDHSGRAKNFHFAMQRTLRKNGLSDGVSGIAVLYGSGLACTGHTLVDVGERFGISGFHDHEGRGTPKNEISRSYYLL